MKVTVCELPDTWARDETLWKKITAHLASETSDLLVLPEMPFYTWITRSDRMNPAISRPAGTSGATAGSRRSR